MRTETLTRVALRNQALFVDVQRSDISHASATITPPVAALIRRLAENGYCVTEELLHALTKVSTDSLAVMAQTIADVKGLDLNWAPLVKGWDCPTGESPADHLMTWLANVFGEEAGFKGITLPCGHLIPEGTFQLERYNGCPFCGTPFKTANYVYRGQASRLKELRLFCYEDIMSVFRSLLTSATPLDATQSDSLKLLLSVCELPEDCEIGMKETAMMVLKHLLQQGKEQQAQVLLKTPTDILRYLWYEKTGHVQLLKPKVLIRNARRLYAHHWEPLDRGQDASEQMRQKLKLHYDRKTCRRVAGWLNQLPMSAQQAAEDMNPQRGMWVQMIHALRLGAYARRDSYARLRQLLDTFYHQTYTTWQGRVDAARQQNDTELVLKLLRQRPGIFARTLFSNMLRFGSEPVLSAFSEIADKLSARLLLSLGNAADSYFSSSQRLARPITGLTHRLEPNPLTKLYSDDELYVMARGVSEVYKNSMARRFGAMEPLGKTIFIDPRLFDIPVSVGDRATTIQDASCALLGTRFPVEGDAIRLFMQWGKGLKAQHLDMDLSCRVTFQDNLVEECAYYSLTCIGAKHSGDIRSIPDEVGTAEYIELSIPELQAADAQYVVFTCNAYSGGALSPNLVVGWMDSAFPMTVSETDGVAYDPSCVQQMVRISEGNLSKGLVFGVFDVSRREMVWLEMPFTSQTLQGCDSLSVQTLLCRLRDKLTIGQLLAMKQKAQGLTAVADAELADEKYTYEWALNPAEVSRLLG